MFWAEEQALMRVYTRDGREYRAWSAMLCRDEDSHPCHVWSAAYLVNGPYFCEGVQ